MLHSTPEVFIIRLQLHIAMPCTHSGIVRDKFGNSASNPGAPLPPPPPATQRVCCLAMISTVTQTRNRSLHAFRSVSTCVCVCAPFSALPVVQMSRYTFINWACVWGCARTRACWFCSERLFVYVYVCYSTSIRHMQLGVHKHHYRRSLHCALRE